MKHFAAVLFTILLASAATAGAQETDATPAKVDAKGIIARVSGVTEPFRITQAAHFKIKRDEVKARIGIEVSEKVGEIVQDKVQKALTPDTPGTAAEQDAPEQEDTGKAKPLDNPLDYLLLVLYMALAAFFASALVFYAGSIMLVLIIIRRMMSRSS